MYDKVNPKFVKKYLKLSDDIVEAVKRYGNDVRDGKFPAAENTFFMDKEEFGKLKRNIEERK